MQASVLPKAGYSASSGSKTSGLCNTARATTLAFEDSVSTLLREKWIGSRRATPASLL
jgi:hypothetical protein